MKGDGRVMCHVEYVVGRDINEELNFLMEESGDDCFTDDLGYAKLYSQYKEIPMLQKEEFVLRIQVCDDGSLDVLSRI